MFFHDPSQKETNMDLTELTKQLRRPLKVGGVPKALTPRNFGPQRESSDIDGSRSWDLPAATLADAVDCETRRRQLVASLKEAIRIEFFTIPPYLTAMWSIIDDNSSVYATLKDIAIEEMYHFAFVCNMLVAISDDGLEVADFKPSYPNKLPGGARPYLRVSLRKCDKMQIEKFADIESFDSGGDIDTIGEFYATLQASFVQYIGECKPTLKTDRQVDYAPVFKIESKEDVEKAIGIIAGQGEGKPKDDDPTDPTDGGLAHYFQFKELEFGVRYKKIGGKWQFDNSDPISLPQCYDMADIPCGGYDTSSMPADARELLVNFRDAYSLVLSTLTSVWNDGGDMFDAIYPFMGRMTTYGRVLMTKDIGADLGKYGPDFIV